MFPPHPKGWGFHKIKYYETTTKNISVKQAVTEQIISMLNNNIINENGNETFEGWCEDGAVFENTYEGREKKFYVLCEKLMREVAPLVDKLTYDYLADF